MCLSIPVKVQSIDGSNAIGELGGSTLKVRIDLMPDTKVGEYVLVHSGYAIERLNEADALETLDLFREMMSHEVD
jgi:hydrogenase expression/formation protein HypC